MSLQDITNKILTDAHRETERILQASRAEIKKVVVQKDKEIAEAVQAIEEKGKEKAAKLKEQAMFKIRTMEKDTILKVSQELIDQVFAMAKNKLAQFSDSDFVKLMTAIFRNTPLIDNAEVRTSTAKKNLVSKAIKKAGLSYKIAKDHLPKDQEGFILISKTIEINCTIDNLVDSKKEEMESEVAEILFK